MKKNILVVVYSRTGTSRTVAGLLAAEGSGQLAVVRDADARRGVMRCMLDSWLRRRPKIVYEGPDPASFDVVVLVAPIWAMRLAGPMRTFVASRAACLHRVVVVSVMGDEGADRAVAEVARLLGHRPALDASFKERDVRDGSFVRRLRSLAASVADMTSATSRPLGPAVLSPEAT